MTITIYTKDHCPACMMTKNIMHQFNLQPRIVQLNPDEPKSQAIINQLKTKYHAQQLPVVLIIDQANQVINHWTGFHPELIKQL